MGAKKLPKSSTPPSADQRTPPYAWVVLAMLTLVYCVGWIDRFSLIILIVPISHEIPLSDAQMGLLTGFGFAAVYSIAGLPIARLADKGSRKRIIAISLLLFSTMTLVMGTAGGFGALLASRAGIAAAEAGISPAAYSLIAQYFLPKRRAVAIAIYSLGTATGQWIGLSAGGWLSTHSGWRNAMFTFGGLGLVLALLFALIVREPKREATAVTAPDFREALKILREGKAFLALALGLGLSSFASNAFGMWAPTYLIREMHISLADVGRNSGLLLGLSGIIGSLGGALLVDRLSARDGRWYIWFAIGGTGALLLCEWLFFFGSQGTMYAAYFAIQLFAAAVAIPIFTVAQSMVPSGMRALGTAVLLFALNVLGVGAGPFMAGMLSDFLKPLVGAHALRDAILLIQIGGVAGILSLLYAARHYHAHIARLAEREAAASAGG